MKAFSLYLIAALTLSACENQSPSKGDGRSTATDMAATPPTLAAPPVQPGFGMVGSVAGNQSAVEAGGSAGRQEMSPEAPSSAADPLQNINTGTATPSMVIRTGQAFIEVEKVDPAVIRIRQLAVQFGAYIANSSMSGGRDQIRQATFELKIPAARYDEAVSSLSTIGKVETVSSNAQDVGEEFVDVTARVGNARRLEERLISLLANRTGKLDEVLRVERELARVREEIERYEGRLRFLTTRVATSTLTITVHEPAPILGSNPGENPIASALRRAWRNFVALLAGTIASLGVLIPLALVGAAGWYGYKRWRHKA